MAKALHDQGGSAGCMVKNNYKSQHLIHFTHQSCTFFVNKFGLKLISILLRSSYYKNISAATLKMVTTIILAKEDICYKFSNFAALTYIEDYIKSKLNNSYMF